MSRLVAMLETLLCSGVPTQFAIASALRVAGMQSLDASGQLSLPFVVILSLGDTVALVLLMLVMTRSPVCMRPMLACTFYTVQHSRVETTLTRPVSGGLTP